MDELITTAEVAAALGVNRSTIIRRVPEHLTPAGKLPGRTGAWLFTPQTVDELRAQMEDEAQ